MKQEYINISKDCFCEKCNKKIKIDESVYAVNDDWIYEGEKEITDKVFKKFYELRDEFFQLKRVKLKVLK